jgi:hypothetical protein
VRVAQATPAGERALGPGRVLITVACQLAGHGRGTLYLAVPVGRDPAGGLAVSGLPSLVAPPATGQVDAEEAQPLAGGEAEAIRRLTGRFLAAYLNGLVDEPQPSTAHTRASPRAPRPDAPAPRP